MNDWTALFLLVELLCLGGERKGWASLPTMAIIIFDDKMLLHTGSIIRGWRHCFVNDPNIAFVNIVLAVSMLLPYHPLCYKMKLEEGTAQSICGAWVPQKETYAWSCCYQVIHHAYKPFLEEEWRLDIPSSLRKMVVTTTLLMKLSTAKSSGVLLEEKVKLNNYKLGFKKRGCDSS